MRVNDCTQKIRPESSQNAYPKTNYNQGTLESSASPPFNGHKHSRTLNSTHVSRKQTIVTYNSTHLNKTAPPTIAAPSPTSPCITTTVPTLPFQKEFPKGCLLERHFDGYCKGEHQSSLNKTIKEEPRLSLANFQDHLRMLGKTSNPITKETDTSAPKLRLEGKQCGGILERRSQTAAKSGVRTAVKLSDQSNLAEFNRILSKMHLEQNDIADEMLEVGLKTVPVRRKAAAQSIAVRKKVINNSHTTRENVTVNIINFAQAKKVPERSKCYQAYLRYFLKDQEGFCAEPARQNPLSRSQLAKELNDIKREVAEWKRKDERNVQHQRFTKYTTSFIEKKLTTRKSLMRDYTFKKRPGILQDSVCDEFDVEGWNNIETDPMGS